MSNTKKRIVSAIILISILLWAIYIGSWACKLFAFVIGVLTVDEIYCNFFKKKRYSINYLNAQAIFIIPFLIVNFVNKNILIQESLVIASLILNIILIFYLFCTDIKSPMFTNLGINHPSLASIFILLPLIALTSIFSYQEWQILLGTLLLVTYSMDTGAWFFGKKFGKHKLWPDVSPKKTLEGLIGGMLSAGIIGGLFWGYFSEKATLKAFILFLVLGLLSQVGDLIQSKFKRQFQIKDSSSLIPGHGGVYDRVDSLIFVTPFYATALRFIHF